MGSRQPLVYNSYQRLLLFQLRWRSVVVSTLDFDSACLFEFSSNLGSTPGATFTALFVLLVVLFLCWCSGRSMWLRLFCVAETSNARP